MRFKVRFTLNRIRKNGILSGYRPTWTSDSKPEYNSSAVYWSGEGIGLGETREAIIIPLVPHMWEKVMPNDILRCMEGNRQVGEAIVLEILPDVPVVQ